jgi:hypothetical protein
MVGPAVAAAVGEYPAGAERFGDPGGVDGRGKVGICLRQAGMSEVSQCGLLEEVDPCKQVSFVGVSSRQLGGFLAGKLLDYPGYRASALGIQYCEIEIVRLADDLGRVELRYFPDAAHAEFVKATASARAEAVQAGQDARMAGEQRAGFSMEVAHLRGFWVEYQIPAMQFLRPAWAESRLRTAGPLRRRGRPPHRLSRSASSPVSTCSNSSA